MLNILTVDLEEYFHPTELQAVVAPGAWNSLTSRVDLQTNIVLDMLDEHNIKSTFFVLGWVAEKSPRLIQRIVNRGHEIGCHSYAHQLVYDLTPDEFRADLDRAVNCIGDACGVRPRVYRAPSYSITEKSLWALSILVEHGFTHDSSIYPIRHDRYGIPNIGRHVQTVRTQSGPIREIPIATVKFASGRVAPVGGGGYLRLLPYCYTAAGVRRINQEEKQPACLYFHPWEIDIDQPKLASGTLSRLRTYTGLRGMRSKLERLMTDFQFTTLTSVQPAEAIPVLNVEPLYRMELVKTKTTTA
jgi:polysaccharide deacetylase family protein (PEP-CTERM system associated)